MTNATWLETPEQTAAMLEIDKLWRNLSTIEDKIVFLSNSLRDTHNVKEEIAQVQKLVRDQRTAEAALKEVIELLQHENSELKATHVTLKAKMTFWYLFSFYTSKQNMAVLEERERMIEAREARLSENEKKHVTKALQLQEQKDRMKHKQAQLEDREHDFEAKELKLEQRINEVFDTEQALSERDSFYNTRQEAMKKRQFALAATEESLLKREVTVKEKETKLRVIAEDLQTKTRDIQMREASLNEKAHSLAFLEESLRKKSEALSLEKPKQSSDVQQVLVKEGINHTISNGIAKNDTVDVNVAWLITKSNTLERQLHTLQQQFAEMMPQLRSNKHGSSPAPRYRGPTELSTMRAEANKKRIQQNESN